MRIGIVGYGHLGRAVERAARKDAEISCIRVFTRRPPDAVHTLGTEVCSFSEIGKWKGKIETLVVALGSTDLHTAVPPLLADFSTVDAFDMHGELRQYHEAMNSAAKAAGHAALIACGWDPGIFSLFRLFGRAFMPDAVVNTFWGPGVSQGHSAVLTRIPGVKYAREYTVPRAEAKAAADAGSRTLTDEERHRRVCYVVPFRDTGEERQRIEREIRAIPHYFAGYETVVYFITEEEYLRTHREMPHAGEVISVAASGEYAANREAMKLSVDLASNPEFTAGVLLAGAKAVGRLMAAGIAGAKTFADIPPRLLLPPDFDRFFII